MIGIYKVTNPKGKVYIGQSWNIETRAAYYRTSHCKNQRKLYHSIVKHGWAAHTFDTVHLLPTDITQEILNQYEIFYWQQHIDCGFEMLNIREPGSRGRISEETKKKWKNRVSPNKGKIGPLDPKWGKKWSAEKTERRLQTRKQSGVDSIVSQKMKGRVKSEEHQAKITEALKKPIMHVESGIIYPSRKEAAEAFGCGGGSQGLRPYIKKGIFKYL